MQNTKNLKQIFLIENAFWNFYAEYILTADVMFCNMFL